MSKSRSKKFVKKTHYEHIIDVPDTYIGGIELIEDELYTLEEKDDNIKIIHKKISYVPGLERIYEEILLNAFDQTVREGTGVTKIKVDINQKTGEISIYNDGDGIPVIKHDEYNVWIPAMIFGELLTSSNYDTNQKRITGGKNGYGAKLTNIFSTSFKVETIDDKEKKKFVMQFENNMKVKHKPKITTNSSKPYVQITFTPDFSKFGLNGFTDDIYNLMKKRVYDISACSNKNVNVYLNGNRIKEKTFDQYVNLYIGADKIVKKRVYEVCSERWEVVATMSDETFEQVSFVNGISTKSGTHVNYIEGQLTRKLKTIISKKNKNIQNSFIKNKLSLFIKCFIENPVFNSQSKQELTSKHLKFGSTCILSDKFIKSFSKIGIIDEVLSFAEYKDERKLKKTDGKKKIRLTGIPKLEDANWAGSKKSDQCMLILTEGDSAKTFAISGLTIIGRDKYGIFPLKGKLLNVRQATKTQLLKNEELTHLKHIIGLKQDYKYTSLKETRYGGIIILTDQDVDGSHIKGLVMNWVEHFWPELVKLGFLISMATPIVKCFKGKKVEIFYTETEYDRWIKKNNDGKGWRIKYYKGLGTSSGKEAKEYFKDIETKLIKYVDDDNTKTAINLAFGPSKDFSDIRKQWLYNYDRENIIEQSQKIVTINEFINRDLIHFSNADNMRSIPHVLDGLKPSQRKVLFSALKKNLKNEIKVSQFAGYVSENSAYHHGDMSLMGTIIGMAQNYVSSNNINLLNPNGQFGTRYQNGDDAASSRYIFTNLNDITVHIFDINDTPILNHLTDDGKNIEPEFFVPVVPMILVNGTKGIGTGFSTDVQPHNLDEIIKALKDKIQGKTPKKLHPWYRGYTGKISYLGNDEIPNHINNGRYLVTGSYNIFDEKKCIIEVTEIPIGVATEKYKADLEKLIIDNSKDIKPAVRRAQCITHFDNYSTESRVRFLIYFDKIKFSKILQKENGFIDVLKISKTVTTNNMHLYNPQGVITKYKTTNDILDEYFNFRLKFYNTRKVNMLQTLDKELHILENKVRFIKKVINNTVKIFKMKINIVREQLEEKQFEKFDITNSGKISYDYLTGMPIHSLTDEKIRELKELRDNKREDMTILEDTTIQELWTYDLDDTLELNKKYNKILQDDRESETVKKTKSKLKKIVRKKK